jgi:hypothetical protein
MGGEDRGEAAGLAHFASPAAKRTPDRKSSRSSALCDENRVDFAQRRMRKMRFVLFTQSDQDSNRNCPNSNLEDRAGNRKPEARRAARIGPPPPMMPPC